MANASKVASKWHTAFVFQWEAPEPDEANRSRRLLLVAAIGAALVVLAGSAVALFAASFNQWAKSGFTARPCTAASAQAEFQCNIIEDQSALIPGTVDVLRQVTVRLGQADEFAVTVCGVHSPDCKAAAPGLARTQDSGGAAQHLVGGYISAKLAGDMPGQIVTESEQVQPVITGTDSATWIWDVNPSQAGTFPLILTVTPLKGDSSTPLTAGVPYAISVTVTESTWQHLANVAGLGGSLIRQLGALLGVLGISGGAVLIWLWKHFRKKEEANAEPSAESPTSDEPRTDAAPAHRVTRHRRRSPAPRHRRAPEPRR